MNKSFLTKIKKTFINNNLPDDITEDKLYEYWCAKRLSDKGLANKIKELKDTVFIIRSGMFEGSWYLEENIDVAQKLMSKKTWRLRKSNNPILRSIGRITTTPIYHYVTRGMYENRNPSKEFSTAYYVNNNKDLINSKSFTPFVHYIKYGKKEGRQGTKSYCANIDFNDIYNNRLYNNSPNPDFKASIITNCTNKKINYEGTEILYCRENIKETILSSESQIIYFALNDFDKAFLTKSLKYFKDEAIFAVIKDSELKEGIFSYIELGTDDCFIKGKLLKKENVIIRNPKAFKVLNEFNELDTDESFTDFIFKMLAGGKAAVIKDNSLQTKYMPATVESSLNRLQTLIDAFCFNNSHKLNLIEKARIQIGNNFEKGYTLFNEVFDANKFIKDSKFNILIYIYGFSFGGGEIMPIRLANKLFEMGYRVTVCSYLDEKSAVSRVRGMLRADIPVFYSCNIDELKYYIEKLNIQIISSHHKDPQVIIAQLLEKFPELANRIYNVGTSHGMYENFNDAMLKDLFTNTPLISKTDFWTYVADKNIIPFSQHKAYDKNKFTKIPNGIELPIVKPVDLSEYAIGKDSFTVVLISRALREKGWLNAINAVTAVRKKTKKDIHLLLIGEGEIYEQYSQKSGNSFIHFLGFKDNPCDYFNAGNLCILPSYYASESAPLCIIEAMMCNKPVLASNIGDVKYMLDYNGELAGDIFELENNCINDNTLAEKLERFVIDSDYYNKKVKIAAKKGKLFEISNICNLYINVYNKYYDKVNTEINQDAINKITMSNQFLCDAENKKTPLVSVIVPNYNHSAFLNKRLDCIYNQSYKNIEVILMDDCSSDNSREILSEYAKKYPHISKTLFNKTNSGGVFYQWAKGVENAKGEICWIAESDDYCDVNFLEKTIPAFDDEKVNISYCKYCFVDEKDNKNEAGFYNYIDVLDSKKWHNNYINDAENEVNTALGIKNTIPNASGAVFRRPVNNKVFLDKDWYKMKICGDWIFYLHLLKGGKVAYTVEATSYFRFHSNNSSAKTYSNDVYYSEHAKVAATIKALFTVERDVIQRNYEIIKNFYFANVPNGTEEKLENLYSVDKIMKQ